MDKPFHSTLYNGCNYLSMLVLKINRVSKRDPISQVTQHWNSPRDLDLSNYFTLDFCSGKYNSRGLILIMKWLLNFFRHGPLTRYVNLRVVRAPGMSGTCSPPPWVSDPNTHAPWCTSGSLTSGAGRGNRSQRMHNSMPFQMVDEFSINLLKHRVVNNKPPLFEIMTYRWQTFIQLGLHLAF